MSVERAMACHGSTFFLTILMSLTPSLYSWGWEKENLDLIFLTDTDYRIGASNFSLMRQFLKDVAFDLYQNDTRINIAVAESWYYWCGGPVNYCDNITSFYDSYTAFEHHMDSYWNAYNPNVTYLSFPVNLFVLNNYWFDYRMPDTADFMIFMISDGYHLYTKENAKYVRGNGTTVAAIIRTDNETEVRNMEDATGDPLRVSQISSFEELSSVIQTTVNIILMGGVNTSGIPDYEVQDVDITFHLVWENDKPFLVFSCDYNISAATNLLHSIQWYVDDRTFGSERLFYSNETRNNTLSEQELTANGYHHGITLKCRVGAKYTYSGQLGRTKSSSFFAGLQVLTQSITLEEGGEASLKFRPTIPVICENGNDKCFLSVQIENPESLTCKSSAVVAGGGACRVKIPGHPGTADEGDWKKDYNLTVKHTQGLSWDRQYYHTVALRTTATHHGFWNEHQLLYIQVNIGTDNGLWRGFYCYSHIDPHMMTFDFRHYEQQKQGNYLMYRNTKLDQEVQYETQACSNNDRRPYCICSLAVRAGRDVFLMDLCHSSRFIDFVTCMDNTLSVESDRFSKYEITFPSGTQVHARMMCWWSSSCFLNVDIYPSTSDVNATEGLCGVLDGNCNNDFLKRDGSYSSLTTNDNCPPPYYSLFPDDFSESWRLTDGEDLLPPLKDSVYDNLKPWSLDMLVCSCVSDGANATNSTDNEKDTIDCSYRNYRDCDEDRYRQFTCDDSKASASGRKRGNIDFLRSGSRANQLPILDETIIERSANMSDEDAKRLCNETLQNSTIYGLCLMEVEDMDNSHYENCVLDVKATGDSSMALVALQIVKDICLTIVGKNTTLNESTPEVVQAVKAQACPGDCDEKGTCMDGVCDCDAGYGGDDCSKDLSSPPMLKSNGLCDLREDNCENVKLQGENIFSLNPRCRIVREEIDSNGTEYNRGTRFIDGEQKSQFEAKCPITGVTSKRSDVYGPGFVTSYTISVSNDNETYSDNATVYVYNSMCQSRDPDNGIFILKENYCFIGGNCYLHGTVNPVTNNQTCCSSSDPFAWLSVLACESTVIRREATSSSTNTIVIIVVVVSCTLVFAIGTVLIYLKIAKFKRGIKGVEPIASETNMPHCSGNQGEELFSFNKTINSAAPNAHAYTK